MDRENVSTQCQKDSLEFIKSLKNFELWALKMYDASAKLPSGILNGNINQYGDFDQCLNVESKSKSFNGQYCLTHIMVAMPKNFHYLNYLRKFLMSLEFTRSRFEDVRTDFLSCFGDHSGIMS